MVSVERSTEGKKLMRSLQNDFPTFESVTIIYLSLLWPKGAPSETGGPRQCVHQYSRIGLHCSSLSTPSHSSRVAG